MKNLLISSDPNNLLHVNLISYCDFAAKLVYNRSDSL